jgi:hypothetical protein
LPLALQQALKDVFGLIYIRGLKFVAAINNKQKPHDLAFVWILRKLSELVF